jgi:hypothetical protein
MLVGYMRVSTSEQNLALQRDALEAAGCARLYEDTCSGSVTERRGLVRALDKLRNGDALVVWKLDRIGRSLGHVVELVAGLQAKGIGLKVLTGGIDSTSSTGRLVFGISVSTLYAYVNVLFAPAEDALDHRPTRLRCGIAAVTGGPRIDGAAALPAGLGQAADLPQRMSPKHTPLMRYVGEQPTLFLKKPRASARHPSPAVG